MATALLLRLPHYIPLQNRKQSNVLVSAISSLFVERRDVDNFKLLPEQQVLLLLHCRCLITKSLLKSATTTHEPYGSTFGLQWLLLPAST
jgi:hypothetical protein